MKFTTQLLAILTASTVYSFELFKRDLNVGPECQKELDTVKEFQCVKNQVTISNYKEVCPYVLSEDCTKFFEDPLAYLPSCKDENDFEGMDDKKTMEFTKNILYLKCTTDGDGNLCPAGEALIKGLDVDEENVKETCKSKKCIIALNDALTTVINQSNGQNGKGVEINGDSDIFLILKDDLNKPSCSAQAKDDTKSSNFEANSGDNSIYKLGSSLLLTFAMVLAYF